MSNSGFHQAAPPKNIPQKTQPNLEFQYLQENNKKHPILVVLLIIIFIIALIIAGYLSYNYFKNEQNNILQKDIKQLDLDGDLLSSLEELEIGTNPEEYDSDFDKIPDGWEVKNKLDPKDYLDATLDFDEDHLNNFQEFQYNCDPNKKDTDNDGFNDHQEVKNGFNPNGKGKIIK